MRALLVQRLIDILHREDDMDERCRLVLKWVRDDDLSVTEFKKLAPMIIFESYKKICR